MSRRLDMAQEFLRDHDWQGARFSPLAGDASFRKYFRVERTDRRAVLMDAPPEYEDARAFLAITSLLRSCGLSAPEILAADTASGFLLLEDLGDDKFTDLLKETRVPESTLYDAAVDLLLALQRNPAPPELTVQDASSFVFPNYSMADLLEEVELFVDWYLPAIDRPIREDGKKEYLELWQGLLADIAGCHDVIVLRDYHADNLIWLPDRKGVCRVGLLDYQDARRGHPAYDLVSLLQDARRDVPPELERRAVRRFLTVKGQADTEFDSEAFLKSYGILGAQRNAKIIGIFTRLSRRDGKNAYLELIPRVWKLLERDLEHPGLAEARDWFDAYAPPGLRQRTVTRNDEAGVEE